MTEPLAEAERAEIAERWRRYMDDVTGGRYSGCTCYEPGRSAHPPGTPCPFHDEARA